MRWKTCSHVAGNPASEHLRSRPPNPAPASKQGIEKIREWVRHCDQNHGDACKPSGSGTLPSRVIDVSGGDKLKLYETENVKQGRYAALSYCWGGPQKFQTDSSTILDRKQGFSINDLPKTLQDAVRVTRELGIQYLWVDSMCIIQDKQEDKFHEISNMADIYKNAYVTICAARANTADSGFLEDRSDPDTGLWKALVPLAYPIPNRDAASLQDAVKMPREATGTIWILDEQPNRARAAKDFVSQRAWCLQERILSPRLLSFGRWPTWRCNRLVSSDGGFYVQDGKDDSQDRKFIDALIKFHRTGSVDLFRTIQLYKTWRFVVEDYTKRKLSLDSDRLLAVGGIAREISHMTGIEYMAGLWKNNVLHDLMWHARAREWLTRPVAWRAPSWSWASVDCPILYNAITQDATPLAQVLSCNVTPATGNSVFEQVTSGTVEIRGPFAEITRADVLELFRKQDYGPAPPISGDVQEWYLQILNDIDTTPERRVSQEETESAFPKQVFGLITFTRDWMQDVWDKGRPKVMNICYSGLLLRETEDGQYERIGCFVNDDADCLNQTVQPWEERTVELV
jgi:hypothetical protein